MNFFFLVSSLPLLFRRRSHSVPLGDIEVGVYISPMLNSLDVNFRATSIEAHITGVSA